MTGKNKVLKPLEFKNAYYVKLGRKGSWEESSINENKIRVGYNWHTLNEINNKDWNSIFKVLMMHHKKKATATKDLNELKTIYYSTPLDIWITFHSSQLWWCRVGEQKIYEDKISRYRKISGKWSNKDLSGNTLLIGKLSGRVTKTQGYRGTICKVNEKDDLIRILNNVSSNEAISIKNATSELLKHIEKGLRLLHWKDFEILIDLIFRNSGWKRLSSLGENMKFSDLELEEPITKDLYQVQIKSKASLRDFKEYEKHFSDKNFRKLYFIVHSPEINLLNYKNKSAQVEIVLPNRVAKLVIENGLTEWLTNKIK